MKYLIVAFKSRNNLLSFVKMLRYNGVAVDIINTPRSISVSCGLSAKTDFRNINLIINKLSQINYESFIGIYLVERIGTQEQVIKIY